jgi:NAD(P)-dependent dehydrogenase (short-subunit alcohol dehydrogenase family)
VTTAIVTGGASGIGAAIAARLTDEGLRVTSFDLVDGFDVGAPEDWETVGPTDVACLNAGILCGPPDPAELDLERVHRAFRVNVDGVVLGVRRLARVMPVGGRIVCTASLAGLTAMPDDPVYAATKHAVVGFVRSVAPSLQLRGLTINVVCPGIADTPMVDASARQALDTAGFPLLDSAEVADAVWTALASGLTGHAWALQPGRPPLDFRFPNVPGPRDETGAAIVPPPPLRP